MKNLEEILKENLFDESIFDESIFDDNYGVESYKFSTIVKPIHDNLVSGKAIPSDYVKTTLNNILKNSKISNVKDGVAPTNKWYLIANKNNTDHKELFFMNFVGTGSKLSKSKPYETNNIRVKHNIEANKYKAVLPNPSVYIYYLLDDEIQVGLDWVWSCIYNVI